MAVGYFIRAPWSDGEVPPEYANGVSLGYATQKEALDQAAWDLREIESNPNTRPVEHIYKANFGEHVDPEKRKIILPFDEIRSQAKKIQKQIADSATRGEEKRIEELHAAVREGRAHQAVVPGNAYTVVTGGTATAGATALTAATAKTVIGIAAGAANQPSIVEVEISFDGVTASAVPVLCEFLSGTNATNAPGTASTSMTPKQIRGWPAQASQATAAYAWSTEPTVLEVYKKMFLTPNGGLLIIQSPLGRETTGFVTASTQFKFIGIRLTAPATVNTHVYAEYEE